MKNTTITHLLDSGDFTELIKKTILIHVRDRVEKEVRPEVESLVHRIYEEEMAKMAIELSRIVQVDRTGSDLRIVLHHLPKEEKK